MRIPETLDDCLLLQDEPFGITFSARRFAVGRTRRGRSWTDDLAKEVGVTTECSASVLAWSMLAFHLTSRDPKHLGPVPVDDAVVQLFVEFYWNTFLGDTTAALLLVNRARASRGFTSFYDSLAGARDACETDAEVDLATATTPGSTKRPARSDRKPTRKKRRTAVSGKACNATDAHNDSKSPDILPAPHPRLLSELSGVGSDDVPVSNEMSRCSSWCLETLARSPRSMNSTSIAVASPPPGKSPLPTESLAPTSPPSPQSVSESPFPADAGFSGQISLASSASNGRRHRIADMLPTRSQPRRRGTDHDSMQRMAVLDASYQESVRRGTTFQTYSAPAQPAVPEDRVSLSAPVPRVAETITASTHASNWEIAPAIPAGSCSSPSAIRADTRARASSVLRKKGNQRKGAPRKEGLRSLAKTVPLPCDLIPLEGVPAGEVQRTLSRKRPVSDLEAHPRKRNRRTLSSSEKTASVRALKSSKPSTPAKGEASGEGQRAHTAAPTEDDVNRGPWLSAEADRLAETTPPAAPPAVGQAESNNISDSSPDVQRERPTDNIAQERLTIPHDSSALQPIRDYEPPKSVSQPCSPATPRFRGPPVPIATPPQVQFVGNVGGWRGERDATKPKKKLVVAPLALNRPALPAGMRPPIWAATRQEVCETLHYFKCYQGGVYYRDELVRGYLLGGHGTSGDVLKHDGKLIISHGGGKNELGERRSAKDQAATDVSVRALLNTWRKQTPVVLLADDKYRLFPYDLQSDGYAYVVLGSYVITHAWPQRQTCGISQTTVVRWLFAFQWCEGQGSPWWHESSPCSQETAAPTQLSPPVQTAPNGRPIPVELAADSASAPSLRESHSCSSCSTSSVQVYERWMCLNLTCTSFGKDDDDTVLGDLGYAASFLELEPEPAAVAIISNRNLEIPAPIVKPYDGITTTAAFKKGFCCPECGRVSSRYKWAQWECRNAECKTIFQVQGRIQMAWELQSPAQDWAIQYRLPNGSPIQAPEQQEPNSDTRICTFTLPVPSGSAKAHLVTASGNVADRIFELYQEHANEADFFRRWSQSKMQLVRGGMLSDYYSHNAGEPYQYVSGTQQTVPLSEAPEAVRRALALIQERAALALKRSVDLNEVLSAGYMEKQKMNFHSDDERGLGPDIAALSLGSRAIMHFRQKPQGKKCDKATKGDNKTVLSLELRHGDVVVMEGLEFQRYYQHAVIPAGFRIAATARYIQPRT